MKKPDNHRNLTLKQKLHALRELWKVLKYDDPKDLCFVARWTIQDGTERTGISGVLFTDLSLLMDLRNWQNSIGIKLISHSGELKEANEKDGLEIGKPTR